MVLSCHFHLLRCFLKDRQCKFCEYMESEWVSVGNHTAYLCLREEWLLFDVVYPAGFKLSSNPGLWLGWYFYYSAMFYLCKENYLTGSCWIVKQNFLVGVNCVPQRQFFLSSSCVSKRNKNKENYFSTLLTANNIQNRILVQIWYLKHSFYWFLFLVTHNLCCNLGMSYITQIITTLNAESQTWLRTPYS